MQSTNSRLPGFLLILLILAAGLLIFLDMPVENSLAYPPPTTSPYPSPAGTATTTPLVPAPPPLDPWPYWGSTTWTPWPTPSPAGLAPTTTSLPPRKGVGGAKPAVDLHRVADWFYTWSVNSPNWPNSTAEFVPMAASNNAIQADLAATRWAKLATARPPDEDHYWLVFNECENDQQCNLTPEEAADYYREVVLQMNIVDPEARLIIGGVNAGPCGVVWLKDFVDAYEVVNGEIPRAGWHFHLYPEVIPIHWNPATPHDLTGCDTWNTPTVTSVPSVTPAAYWKTDENRLNSEAWQQDAWNMIQFVNEYGSEDDELWITEMGCPFSVALCDDENGFMYAYTTEMMNWLNSEGGTYVDRYAWFMTWGHNYFTNLYDFPSPTPTSSSGMLGGMSAASSTPTSTPEYYLSTLGNYYKAITPAPPRSAWLDYFQYNPIVFK